MTIARRAIRIEATDYGIAVNTDGPEVRIMALTDHILRVRASFERLFPEHSYSLVMTAWDDELDGFYGSMRTRVNPIPLRISDYKSYVECATQALTLRIYRDPYYIELSDANSTIVHSDLPGRVYKKDPQGRVYHYMRIDRDSDNFYGFGETAGPLNKRGNRIRQAPRDAFAYDAMRTGPLYKHIPFYIKLCAKTGIANGLFYHNTFESVFDMGCERSGYFPPFAHFCADGGDVDLFIIYGPQMSDVVKRYTDLTGKSALPPLCALGYLGSSMFYTELPKRSDERICEFVDNCHAHGIPISNFHLSSGYSADPVSGKRFVFTWNRMRFPDPDEFFAKMEEKGVTVTPNVKPGMLVENPYYAQFDEAGAFVRTSDGAASYVDRWWGGNGSFVDFTNPNARKMWKDLLIREIISRGTVSVWNDNCEYDSLDDRNALCNGDGKPRTIDELKSVQSLLMAHVACEAIAEAKPNMRPFVVTRSGFAGFQRYASTWSGDNVTSWDTLKYNIATMLGMGLSGVAINGCDTGGFAGPSPEMELLVRWVQNSIFHPRFSIHSCNDNNTVTEPWMYEDAIPLIRDAIRLRYSLLPYLYSLCYHAHVTGEPIARPLVYEFQNDRACDDIFTEFMLGPFLLVAPVIEKGVKSWKVYLPKGCTWYCWQTRALYEGGRVIDIPVSLESIPLFIRGASVIPLAVDFTDINRENIRKLHIIVAPGGKVSFTLFEDDGKTFAYKSGKCLLTTITAVPGLMTTVKLEKQGDYESAVREVVVELIEPQKSPIDVRLNGHILERYLVRQKWLDASEGWYYSHSRKSILIKYAQPFGSYEVTVNFGNFDLLGM